MEKVRVGENGDVLIDRFATFEALVVSPIRKAPRGLERCLTRCASRISDRVGGSAVINVVS